MLGMGTDHLLGTAWVDFAILGDVVVVTGGGEASCLVAWLRCGALLAGETER
jgi:hypothetical protein